MLARLDAELAPLRSSVNREGSLLRVDGSGDAEVEAQVAGLESMGYIAQPVEEVPNVSRWFGAAEVDELSREEAAVLAQQWATELADEGIVQDSSGLPDILSAALLASFREAARTGEIGAVDLDEEALGAAIERVEAQAVRAWIKTRTGHPSR